MKATGPPLWSYHEKDGSPRFCIDSRQLNDITKKDAYPLQHSYDALKQLAFKKYFSTFDSATFGLASSVLERFVPIAITNEEDMN